VEQSTTSGGGGQPGDAGDVEDELDWKIETSHSERMMRR
jgi:hypothetical protein